MVKYRGALTSPWNNASYRAGWDGDGRLTCGGWGDDDASWKIVRRKPARGDERRRFDSVRGRRANRYDTRRRHRGERSGGAKGVDIKPLKYHCGAELVARGGKTMEPLGLQAVSLVLSALRVFQSVCWGG